MIRLALIAEKYQQELLDKYGDKMQSDHRRALQQIIALTWSTKFTHPS